MNPDPDRRDFLKTALCSALTCAGIGWLGSGDLRAIEPFRRSGPPRFKTSLVGYSFRQYFTAKDPARRITLFDLIDYAAAQGFAGVELTGYYIPQPVSPEYLIKLKRHAYLRGMAVSGTSFNNNLGAPSGPQLEREIAAVKAWIDTAALLGAPYVRVGAHGPRGRGATRGAIPDLPACFAAFEECAAYAGTKGVFVGLENDGSPPAEVLEIVHGVKNPWFGLNLDLGNFQTTDVYGDLARCAPYAVNVHFKMEIHEAGKAPAPADVPRLLKILGDAGYQGYLAFEFEGKGDPYAAIPGWLRRVKEDLAAGGVA